MSFAFFKNEFLRIAVVYIAAYRINCERKLSGNAVDYCYIAFIFAAL